MSTQEFEERAIALISFKDNNEIVLNPEAI